MGKSEVQAKLNELAEAKKAIVAIGAAYDAKRDEILKPVQHELNALTEEITPKIGVAIERVKALEEEIKASVLELGETVRGDSLLAAYNPGKVTWDTKAMLGYSVGHQEVLQFKRVGKPFVSIQEK